MFKVNNDQQLTTNKFKSDQLLDSTRKSFPILFFLLFLLINIPSIPILKIDGLYQPLRIDFILMSIIFTIFIVKSFLLGKIKITLFLFLFLISTCLIYFITSSSLLVALVQLIGYASIIISFAIIKDVADKDNLRIVVKYFSITVLSQIFFHFLGLMDINYNIILDGKTYHLFGKYGTFGMPFKFGLFCLASIFILGAFKKKQPLFLLLLMIAVITSDSRISMISFFIYLFLTIPSWTPIIIFVSMFSVSFLTSAGKFTSMISIISSDFSSIINEGSLVMRVVNFQRYLDWVNLETFIFGAGALSFLEYGIGYGEKGPLDITFLRLITEFGIVISLIIILLQYRILSAMSKSYIHLIALFIAIVSYSIFNEGIMALRSGHYFFAASALAIILNKRFIK